MKMKIVTMILILFFNFNLFGQMDYSEKLLNSTTRIESIYPDGKIGTGSGFFFNFKYDDSTEIPVLITNKHVISNSKKVKLVLTKKKNGQPDYGNKITVEVSTTLFIPHPDSTVDLTALPLAYIKQDFYYDINSEMAIPTKEIEEEFLAIEEVLMIGYPRGIWDEVNNMPIVRRGLTATNLTLDYNGKGEFLIDIAAFNGSSGSPIYIYNSGPYQTKKSIKLGGRIYLIGVLYSGPLFPIQGQVIDDKTKTGKELVSSTIPMNLGIVIKSKKILDFKKPLMDLHTKLKK